MAGRLALQRLRKRRMDMDNAAVWLLLIAGFLVCWLRVFPFTEKKTREPERTADAVVTARTIKSGANRSGRSVMGYSYLVSFRLTDGKELELYAHDVEYGALREGMEGRLTWKGRYFVSFEQEN